MFQESAFPQSELGKIADIISYVPSLRENRDGRGAFVGWTKGRKMEVFDRPDFSHAQDHGASKYLKKALEKIELPDQLETDERMAFCVEMGEVIGQRDCVAVNPTDKIIYAIRKGRGRWGNEYSRFVMNREPLPCSSVVVVLYQPPLADYLLVATAFIGKLSAKELSEKILRKRPDLLDQSLKFWLGIGSEEAPFGHALIFDVEKIDPKFQFLSYDSLQQSPFDAEFFE